ncbi:hypothetical protein ABLE91_20640 [Aquabacter sp. CN5-332]|uniref:hypothetical protein n=1 Tax=Aquabacter sp. CN5-332 TaxID=3156608 RepID=UPI0032B5FA34
MAEIEFYRKNLLIIHPDLNNPAPQLRRADNTVLVELVDVTKDHVTVKRQKQRNALARLIVPKSRKSFWETPSSIYKVCPATPGNRKAFPAYICPYSDNAIHSMMLGQAAEIMFTGEMDGCTFGVGMPNRDGGVRVAHANAQLKATGSQWKPNFTPQREEQDRMLSLARADAHTVQPAAYRDRTGPRDGTERTAVIIGLRNRATWEFYYQKQQSDGNDLRNLMELVKIN